MTEKEEIDIRKVINSESARKAPSKGSISDSYDILDDCDIMRWIIGEEVNCSSSSILTSVCPTPPTFPVTFPSSAKRPFSEDLGSSAARRKSKKRRKLNCTSLKCQDVGSIVQNANLLSDQKVGRSRENVNCSLPEPLSLFIEGDHQEDYKCSIAEEVHISEQEKHVLQIQRAMIADEDGDRPIHLAVVQENVDLVHRICSVMKSIGASLDLVNNLRQTPLHLAVIIQNPEILKFLLTNGSSVQRQDRHGRTSIQLSIKFFDKECFKILLDHHDSRGILDSLDYEGLSALHYAVLSRNASAINSLYHAGASIDIVDGKSGRSVLMHAILMKDVGLVQLILKCGACVEKIDYSGYSALDTANQMENKEIIQFLEKESSKERSLEVVQSRTKSPDKLLHLIECDAITRKQFEFTYGQNEINRICNL